MKSFSKFIAIILILLVILSVVYIGGKKMLKLPWDDSAPTEKETAETSKIEPELNIEISSKEEQDTPKDESTCESEKDTADRSTKESTSNSSVETIKSGDDSWALILANPSHPVPNDWAVDVDHLQNNKEVDKRVLPFAKEMIRDASADGIDLLIASAYRSVSYQQGLFDRSIENYKSQGYTQEEAEALTKQYYSVPGYSEHHTGLALDIVTPEYQMLNDGYAETDAAKWLLENAHKYGFILRYPKDKEEITNINFEPWHFRYVGVEHATYMKENNLCLEEYLDQR